jgi:hypothetical protein
MGEAQCEVVEHKKRVGRAEEGGNKNIDEIYTLAFSRARGTTKHNSFFLLIIGLEEFK